MRVLQLQGETEIAALVDWDGTTDGDRRQSHWHIQIVEPLVQLAQADDLLHWKEREDEVVDTRLGNVLVQVDAMAVNTDVGGRDGCRGDYGALGHKLWLDEHHLVRYGLLLLSRKSQTKCICALLNDLLVGSIIVANVFFLILDKIV